MQPLTMFTAMILKFSSGTFKKINYIKLELLHADITVKLLVSFYQIRVFLSKLCRHLMSDFRLYDGSDLKTHLLMMWWGPDALAVCWAHRGLPVGFLLLWYSVLFTVESLSLLNLLFIS